MSHGMQYTSKGPPGTSPVGKRQLRQTAPREADTQATAIALPESAEAAGHPEAEVTEVIDTKIMLPEQ